MPKYQLIIGIAFQFQPYVYHGLFFTQGHKFDHIALIRYKTGCQKLVFVFVFSDETTNHRRVR